MDYDNYIEAVASGAIIKSKMDGIWVLAIKRFNPATAKPLDPEIVSPNPAFIKEEIDRIKNKLANYEALYADITV